MDPRLKYWQRLLSSSTPLQLERVRILESNVFKPGIIEFPRALALVGTHGSGKTALLRMLNLALGGDVTVPVPPFTREDRRVAADLTLEGVLDVTIRTPYGAISKTIDIGDSAAKRKGAWSDHPGVASGVQYISPLTVFGGLEVLWDAYGLDPENRREHVYTSRELGEIQNILGRRYDGVSALEVLVATGRDGWELYLPHFTAIRGGREIDSAQMSSGELWVHYVLGYAMQDLDSAAFTLLDEPEAFLSQRGQRAFIDAIARLTLARNRQLLISTHSPDIFSRFPLTHVRVCVDSGDGLIVYQPQTAREVADAVGLQVPVRRLVAVEDNNAARLFRVICAILNPGLDRELEIVAAGGEAEVLAAARTLYAAERVPIWGVLDGDRRGYPALHD